MNLKTGIGLCLSTLTAIGVFTGAGDTKAVDCTGPEVPFTSRSECPSVNPVARSQGFLNAPFPKSLHVSWLRAEPGVTGARGRGFNAAGDVKCSTTDSTIGGGVGPIAGCNTNGANNTITQIGFTD